MKEPFLEQLDESKYQVFLFGCPANIPVNFATHHWFVINEKGKISRWEVGFRNIKGNNCWNHLHKNRFPCSDGINIFVWGENPRWKAKLIGGIEGVGEDSLALKMIRFIENSPEAYPFKGKYSLFGLNSNTYVQWILNNFPEFKKSLPKSAFGKKFRFNSDF